VSGETVVSQSFRFFGVLSFGVLSFSSFRVFRVFVFSSCSFCVSAADDGAN